MFLSKIIIQNFTNFVSGLDMRSIYTVLISILTVFVFIPAVHAEVVLLEDSFESPDWNTIWTATG